MYSEHSLLVSLYMKRLASCAEAPEVLHALLHAADIEWSELVTHEQVTQEDIGGLPLVQKGIAEALMSSGVVFSADGKPAASLTAQEVLERLVSASTPVVAFHNGAGDVRRIYRTVDVNRPLALEITQFGRKRLLSENAVTLSRQLMYGSAAVAKGLSPKLQLIVPLRASDTTPTLITGMAFVYDPPVGVSLLEALSDPKVNTRRAAARETCAAIRRLAAQRIYAVNAVLEDIHIQQHSATIRISHAQRLTSTDAVETITVAMIALMAGQAARVAGKHSSEEFLQSAFEISDTPAWRTKTLRLAAAGLPALERQGILIENEISRFCVALSNEHVVQRIPSLFNTHAAPLMARSDQR